MSIDNLPPEATDEERHHAGKMIGMLVRAALFHRELSLCVLENRSQKEVSRCMGNYAASLAYLYSCDPEAFINDVKKFAHSLGIEVELTTVGPIETAPEMMN